MLELLVLAVTAGVVPIIVNKSTEGEGFDWIKPHLREIWTALFILYVLYGLSRPSAQGIAMMLHQLPIKPWIGYAVMGALGCGLFSGYWWFTGTIAQSTSRGVPPPSPKGGGTTPSFSSIAAERHEQARTAIASLDAPSLMILRKIPAGGLLPEHIHNALTRDGFDGNPDPVIRALKSANLIKSDSEGRIQIAEDIVTDVRDLLAPTPATTADKTSRLGTTAVTTDDIAEAVAKRLESSQVTTGPLPPFSLGGSLERDDLFDIIGDGYPGREVWRPIKKSHDVEIDWHQCKNVELIVDAVVRGGNFRIGLLDVENDISIVESDWIEHSPSDLAWDQLSSPPKRPEEPRHVRIKIPSSVGRKTYRLVVQPTQDTRAATFWVFGQITFPSVSLGGTYMTWFTPSDGTSLSGRVPNSLEAHIDWSMVRNPINTVIADITLLASYPIFQSKERCRATVLDVSDDTRITTSWIDVSWIGGMMASTRPYPGPVMKQLKLELPRKNGTHTYVLEVEVSKAKMSATATGTLFLRH